MVVHENKSPGHSPTLFRETLCSRRGEQDGEAGPMRRLIRVASHSPAEASAPIPFRFITLLNTASTEANCARRPASRRCTETHGGATIGLRALALFEAAKGLLILLVGVGALKLVHANAQEIGETFIRHAHLNPAHHYPRIFIDIMRAATPWHLKLLAFGAFSYAAFRLIEAAGLWRGRAWGEWCALISSSFYLPLEIMELSQGITWPRAAILASNVIIVLYLFRTLFWRRSKAAPHGNPSP